MRRPTRTRIVLAAGLAVAAAAAAGAFAAPTPASATTTASVTSPNLLADGGAENAAQCSAKGLDGMTLPGWTITKGEPDAVCYGAPGGFPTSSTPGSPTRGTAFFTGGGTGDGGLSQTVDVAAAASTIDAGSVPYTLAGWLGGYASQNDRVGVTATFLNAAGATLGTAAQIGPVTNANRGNTTEFLHKTAQGTLPAGTRSVRVDVAFTYSAGSGDDGYADDLSFTIGAGLPAPALTPPPSSVPGFDHVFVVYMENEDYSNIIGSPKAPYINSLLSKGTSLTKSYATTHPSDPNYMALAAGGLYGLYDNSVASTTIDARHIGNSVEAAGKAWKAYAEDENGPCDYTTHGSYYPDDVPFTYFKQFKDDKSSTGYCAQHDVPLTQMATDLKATATTPDFVWFQANDYNDMEAGGIAAGDTWLKNTLPTILTSPAWTQQRSLLILTWDEGAVKSFGPNYPNQVPTILLGSQNSVKAGATSAQRTDQYGLLRTIDKALGLAPLTNNDGYAATVNDAWN